MSEHVRLGFDPAFPHRAVLMHVSPLRIDPLYFVDSTTRDLIEEHVQSIIKQERDTMEQQIMSDLNASTATVATVAVSINEGNGWHDEVHRLRAEVANWAETVQSRADAIGFAVDQDELAAAENRAEIAQLRLKDAKANLRNYVSAKLLLIVTEVAEAAENLRDGVEYDAVTYDETGKPEGFLSELADVQIRVMGLAGELGLIQQYSSMVPEKLAHNAKRGIRHGGRQF